jgi:hypothetical protein
MEYHSKGGKKAFHMKAWIISDFFHSVAFLLGSILLLLRLSQRFTGEYVLQ